MKLRIAMVFGILGGLFGLVVGLFGYSVGAIGGATGLRGAELVQMISIAAPIAGLVGGVIVTTNPVMAALLMFFNAAVFAWMFGLNAFAALPIVLNAFGGLLALAGASDVKRTKGEVALARVEPESGANREGAKAVADDGQPRLPLEENADQTRAAASSVSPAYYAARRHEPARRPPLEDRSFELAKLAVAGVVALAAITAAGVLGWKYLDERPKEVVREVVREVPKEVVHEVVKEVPKEVAREVIREVPSPAAREAVPAAPKEAARDVSAPAEVPDVPQASEPVRSMAAPTTPAPRPETKSRTAAVAPAQSFRGEPANWYQSIVGCCIAYCQLIECNSPPLPKACSPEVIAMNYAPGATVASAKRNYLIGAETIFDDVDLPECR